MRKLARLRPAEIRERLGQAFAIRLDRTRGSRRTRRPDAARFLREEIDWSRLEGPATAAALLDHFRSRPPRFFEGLDDPAATARALEATRPGSRAHHLERAESVLAGRYRLFDLELHLGPAPDWQVEPISGLRYPDSHWSRIRYMEPEIGGEYKASWELSRLQHFLTLGIAYAHAPSARWVERFREHTDAWISENHPGTGIHWASSLELGFRMQSWIWALHLFRRSEVLRPDTYVGVLDALVTHGRHIERFLSTYFSPNTHITGEALALFTLGAAFPELKMSEGWVTRGSEILEHWAEIHMREDGTYFEQSTAYSRYTVDFYTHYLLLAGRLGRTVKPSLVRRLERAVDHLSAVTLPDGTIPLVGDDDGGRAWPVDDRARADVRPAFATAALMFERGDFKAAAADAVSELAWLMGPAALDRFAELDAAPPTRTSRAFDRGGLYLSKPDASPSSDYVLFDSGVHGVFNCGHAHADLLSVVVALDGRPVLVDSGTFTYSYTPEVRNRFRRAAAHNTLTVNGRGPSTPGSPFHWTRITHGAPASVGIWEDACAFAGKHAGFPEGIGHRRSILHLPGFGVALADRAPGLRDGDRARLHFQFPAGSTPRIEGNDVVTSAARLRFLTSPAAEIVPSTVSESYRHEADAHTLTVDLPESGNLTFLTASGAHDSGEGRAVERDATGFICGDPTEGWFVSMAAEGTEPGAWASDADLTGLRVRGGRIAEAVLVGGSTLEVGGVLWYRGDEGVHRCGPPDAPATEGEGA